jgi:peptide/nickel transport system substrate-binding protein
MNKQRGYPYLVAAAISLLLTFDALSKAEAAPFIFALRRAQPVMNLDYIDAQTTEQLLVESQIMEGLVGIDLQDEHLIVPRLAKSFHRIDLYTYVFRLHNDIYFHDHLHGKKEAMKELLTPEDVVYSLRRAQGSSGAQEYRLDNIGDIKTVGHDLLKIKLKKPDDDFLSHLATAMGHVTCKSYYESLGGDEASRKKAFARAPIGTGPFYLARPLLRNRSIILVRFGRYREREWVQSKRGIARVEYRYYDGVTDILAGLERGDVGGAHLRLSTFGEGGNLNPKKPHKFGAVYPLTPPFLSLLAINLTKPELANPLIRRLLNAAVDRAKIEDIGPQEKGYLPGGFRYYLEISKRYQTHRGSVLRLLQTPEAREQLRILRSRGPIELYTNARWDVARDRVVKSIAEDFRTQLGIEVRVRSARLAVEFEAEKPSYDLVYVDWTPDILGEREGLSILYPLFSSGSRTNISHFHDPEVDRLFGQVEGVVDKVVAGNLYTKIQNRLFDNPPHIWLPSVYSNALVYGKGYRSKIRPSLVYYSSFLRYVERIPK